MAGYSWKKGMSNNAVDAYRSGKLPASKMAKYLHSRRLIRGCTAADIRDIVHTSEYHHTGKYFNSTLFYDVETIFDYRFEIRENIKMRKEFQALKRRFKKVGITDVLTNDGRVWFPVKDASPCAMHIDGMKRTLKTKGAVK
jgi:hypothetical protein